MSKGSSSDTADNRQLYKLLSMYSTLSVLSDNSLITFINLFINISYVTHIILDLNKTLFL